MILSKKNDISALFIFVFMQTATVTEVPSKNKAREAQDLCNKLQHNPVTDTPHTSRSLAVTVSHIQNSSLVNNP